MSRLYAKCCPKCGFIGLGVLDECIYCETPYIVTEYDLCENSENGNLKKEVKTAIFEKYIKDNPMYSEEAVKNREEQERHNRLNMPSSYKPKESNTPKCPICQSTNLSKITTVQKAGKIALFGIFGMGDNGKTWKCNNCGSKF